MKKFICLLLVLLIVPFFAYADDTDSLVGSWYVSTGFLDNIDSNDDIYLEFYVLHFTPSGDIFISKYDINNEGVTTIEDYTIIGLWSYNSNKYYIRIGAKGPQELAIEDDSLFFQVTEDCMFRFQRMQQIDYIKDVKPL